MSELLFHGRDHVLPNIVGKIVLLEGVALVARAVPPDGRDVQHARPELDERAPLDR